MSRISCDLLHIGVTLSNIIERPLQFTHEKKFHKEREVERKKKVEKEKEKKYTQGTYLVCRTIVQNCIGWGEGSLRYENLVVPSFFESESDVILLTQDQLPTE